MKKFSDRMLRPTMDAADPMHLVKVWILELGLFSWLTAYESMVM